MTPEEPSERVAAILLGESEVMRRVREVIVRVAPTPLSVLLVGPTGSGKELAARALHCASGRDGRFVAFNVSALADGVFEDALFGHVKGAFTGANGHRRGYLEEADRGSLFLDEIGTLAREAQAKLLRALDTKEFRPVGASKDRKSDFRILAATNEDLDLLSQNGRFREDLRHRLQGAVIHMPPLADRKEDILILAEHFLSEARDDGRRLSLSQAAVESLRGWDWPGNVRELRSALHRAAALFPGATSLGAPEIEAAMEPVAAFLSEGSRDSSQTQLIRTLERCGWNTAEAAMRLGIHRSTVYRRMKRFGIDIPEPDQRNGEAGAGLGAR